MVTGEHFCPKDAAVLNQSASTDGYNEIKEINIGKIIKKSHGRTGVTSDEKVMFSLCSNPHLVHCHRFTITISLTDTTSGCQGSLKELYRNTFIVRPERLWGPPSLLSFP
jgi:hypothetical protein